MRTFLPILLVGYACSSYGILLMMVSTGTSANVALGEPTPAGAGIQETSGAYLLIFVGI